MKRFLLTGLSALLAVLLSIPVLAAEQAELVRAFVYEDTLYTYVELTDVTRPITKADLFSAGLSGGPDSASRRQALLRRLDLPEHMTANAMLEALNVFCTYEEFQTAVSDLDTAEKQ